ncbi:hypothetical protein [Gordonia terrae]|nr:hypothetical protein [Gordonia terrae]
MSPRTDHHTIGIDDLAHDHRWPRFTAAVLEHTPVRALKQFGTSQ